MLRSQYQSTQCLSTVYPWVRLRRNSVFPLLEYDSAVTPFYPVSAEENCLDSKRCHWPLFHRRNTTPYHYSNEQINNWCVYLIAVHPPFVTLCRRCLNFHFKLRFPFLVAETRFSASSVLEASIAYPLFISLSVSLFICLSVYPWEPYPFVYLFICFPVYLFIPGSRIRYPVRSPYPPICMPCAPTPMSVDGTMIFYCETYDLVNITHARWRVYQH